MQKTENLPFQSRHRWNDERPNVLVVACSDGRLQENLDDFLSRKLGILRYDRLYAPGGPGALATSGIEFLRSDLFRRECNFLVMAHDVTDVYLIFHGAADDGPENAACADYRRIFPRATASEINKIQERDQREILSAGFGWQRNVRVHVYRCEVNGNGTIQFVSLGDDVAKSLATLG